MQPKREPLKNPAPATAAPTPVGAGRPAPTRRAGAAASLGGSLEATTERLRATIAELHAERSRLLRERRAHLILLGLAISLPFHVLLAIWLASVYLPGPASASPPEVTFELGVLSDEKLSEREVESDIEFSDLETAIEASTSSAAALETAAPAVGMNQSGTGSLDAAGAGPTGTGGLAGGGAGLGPGGGGTASFFGVGGRGSRFAYIVDISGSMSNGERMRIAMDELKRSIAALPDYASIFVCLYSDRPVEPPFQEGYMRAMPSTVTRMKRWLDDMSPMGGTDPGGAFERTFRLTPPPDLIFFLTDGEIPDNVPDYLAWRNGQQGHKRVVIHCIAFSQDASQELLRRIARESEGTFRFVPVAGGP